MILNKGTKMNDYQKYGIEVDQYYSAADGSKGLLRVLDVETYADCGDVVVEDRGGFSYRIDAFKLAMVRYNLVK